MCGATANIDILKLLLNITKVSMSEKLVNNIHCGE
jgi:hypothetical protein